MQKTILTRFFSKSQFLVWGLAIFGMLSFSGNAYGQCATIAAGPSLMNPGFEDGFDQWTTFGNPNGFSISAANPTSGLFHAIFQHGGGEPGMFQGIPASAGEVITGSFDVFVNLPVTGNEFFVVKLVYRNAANAEIGAEEFQVNGAFPTGVYQTVTVSGTAPANTMRAELFAIFLDNGPPGSGSLQVFLDDASLSSNASLCGSSMMFTVDADCNLPFVNLPELTIDAPCGLVSVTNDFNDTENASGEYPLGTTDVVFTIEDNEGTSTCEFSVEVIDMTAPAVQCGGSVMNTSFDGGSGANWGVAGGAQFQNDFGSDLPDGSGPGMTVLFGAGGFGVIFQGGIPTFEGEQITAGFSGFLSPDFANSGAYGAIKLDYRDANNNPAGSSGDQIIFTDQDPVEEWSARTFDFVIPAGVAFVTVVPVYVGPDAGPAILVDDVVYYSSMNLYEVDNNNEDCLAFVDLFDYIATDACGAVTMTNDFNGEASADGLYPLGTTMVTTTFEDEAGNTSTCTQTVINTPGGACAEATITDPCVCLDNSTNDTDGQFGELVEVNGSTGDIWTVTASNGLYVVNADDASEQAVAGVVYPLFPVTGIQLVENPVGSGLFQLAGVHVDDIGYSVTMTNLFTGQNLTVANECTYPNVAIEGLGAINNACEEDGVYDLSITPNIDGSVSVIVAGIAQALDVPVIAGAAFAAPINLMVLGVGTYVVEVTFDAVDAPGTSAPGCSVTYDYILTVGEPQGTMTCNDNIQVSLDESCEVTLTPDMILEGTYDTGAFDLTIAGVPGNVLNGSNIGNTYTVTVSDACGVNSCWSTISVEDKFAPAISCLDVVTVCTADITNVTPPTALDNCDPNPTIQLVDSVLGDDDACDDNQVIIVQTYIAIDAHGNQSAPCQRSVVVVRPTADKVNFPDDITWTCEQYAAFPNIIAGTRLIPNELGSTGSGIPTEIDGIYCQYSYTSADVVLSTCGFAASTDAPVFKIVRTWTVLDWCTGLIVTENPIGEDNVQVVKVIDAEGPVVVGADLTVSANVPGAFPQPCKSTGPVPAVTATDNCTGVTQTQGFIYSDVTLNSAVAQVSANGTISPALEVGIYFIVWTAEDACGNATQSDSYELTILDNITPVAVCDEITQVTVTSDGLAKVYAETFDDGSYDNCCLDRLEVRRMDQTCGITGNITFDNDGDPQDANDDPDNGEFVTFCCSDIGNTNMVVLRVFDCSDNYNECMVEVLVEDKLAPTIICPPNATITCDDFVDVLLVDLLACTTDGVFTPANADAGAEDDCQSTALTNASYGTPVALDNCDTIIDVRVTVSIDQCGVGSILRDYIVKDPSDNGSTSFGGFNASSPSSCRQRISVTHVSNWCVEFPADLNLDCQTDEDDIDFGEPEIFFETCELIATSYVDQVFDIVPDACFKIARQWTVINWCTVGDEINQEIVEIGTGVGNRRFCEVIATPDGYITYQQVIKVNDDVAPAIVAGFTIDDLCIITGNNGTDNDFSDCSFSGVLPTPDYTDCITMVNDEMTGEDNGINNPIIITATVFDAADSIVFNSVIVNDLAIGCYKVRYTAIDRCGNTSVDEFDFCVSDCKLPTPYCKDGVVLELMAINDPNNTTFVPMVELWASDLDLGSFDNCAGAVTLSFSADTTDVGNVYTCDGSLNGQLADGAVGTNEVELWVTDASGNQDFCTTFVVIQANQEQCDTGDPLVAVAAGTIADENNEMAENVMVQMSGQSNGTNMTAVDGNYSFDVPMGNDVTVTPSNDTDHDNGVTTFDLVLISKHILGTEALSSPYKMIAADANNSGSITTLDLVQIRKLILQIDNEFNNNTSWRFIDADFDFPNATNPWTTVFPEIININNMDADIMNNDFVAVKIGDVNGSAATNNNLLGADDRSAGKLVIAANDRMVKTGETVTVDFTTVEAVEGYQFTMNFGSALEFVTLNEGTAAEENFGFAMLNERAITASWNGDAAANAAAFSMTFTANADVMLSEALTINSRYTTAEAYNNNTELLDVELNFNADAVSTFELYQNTPNPFNGETTIGFNMTEDGAATLTITDMSGRVLTVIKGNYAQGYNQEVVRNLPATGVMYYTLATANETATKKMVATK